MIASSVPVLRSNPFPGLRPYDEGDSHLFFGREDQTHELLGRLRNLRFLAVLGSSGCGKSSLVRAGVLPALRDGFMVDRPDAWRIALMRPGTMPLANLAQALNGPAVLGREGPEAPLEANLMRAALYRGDFALVDVFAGAQLPADTKLLVVVDQFEELFRFQQGRAEPEAVDEAHRFVQLLLTAAGQRDAQIHVMLTMRSEFLGHCGPYSGLPEAISDGLYLVPRLSREQVRDTIERPIRAFEGKITNRLVNRVLNDLGEEQDQLPVLQHALMRLWSVGQEGTGGRPPSLDIDLYESSRIGGMSQALSQHVKEILRDLNTSQQRLAEILFRNLTAVADNGELVRDPTRLDAIAKLAGASTDAVAAVIECFRGEGKSFLMPPAPEKLTPDKTIDISHESLIRQWDELKKWTRDEHRWRQVRRQLGKDAAKWNREGRRAPNEPDFLLQGLRLAEAAEWRNKHPEELRHASMALEREFLTRSEAHRDETLRERQEARNAGQLRRAYGQLKWAAGIIIVGAVIAACLAVSAYRGWAHADQETTEAKKQKDEADRARKLASRDARRTTAELLANAAGASAQVPAEQAVLRLLLATEAIRSTLFTEHDEIRPGAFRAFEEASRFFTPAGIQTRVLGRHSGAVNSVAHSWDGRWLVTGSEDQTVGVWDLSGEFEPGTNQNYQQLVGHGSAVTIVGVSRDDRWLVAGTADGAVFQRKFRSGRPEPVGRLIGRINGAVSDIEFARHGPWFVVSSDRGAVRAWNLETPDQYTDLQGHKSPVTDIVAFELPSRNNPAKSQWMATGGNDRAILFWNLDGPRTQPNSRLDLGQSWIRVLDLAATLPKSPPESGSGPRLLIGTNEGKVIACTLDCLANQADGTSVAKTEQVSAFPEDAQQVFRHPRGWGDMRSVGLVDDVSFVVAAGDGLYTGRLEQAKTASSREKKKESRLIPIEPEPKRPERFVAPDQTARPITSFVRLGSGGESKPTRRWLANVLADGAIALHQVSESGPLPNPVTLRGHDGDITAATFLGRQREDGRFATVGTDGLVRIWDFRRENASPFRRGIQAASVRTWLSYTGEWIAVAQPTDKGSWELLLQRTAKSEQPLLLSPGPPTAEIAPAEDEKPESSDPIAPPRSRRELVFVNKSNGTLCFVAASDAQGVYIWPILDGNTVGAVSSHLFAAGGAPPIRSQRDGGYVRALAASRGGRWLAAGLSTGRIWIWDLSPLESERRPREFAAHERPIACLAFSADEQFVASGSEDGTVRMWNLADPQQLGNRAPTEGGKRSEAVRGVVRGFSDAVIDIRVSDDGHRLCAVTGNLATEVWNISNPAEPSRIFPRPDEMVGQTWESTGIRRSWMQDAGVELSPNGRWLVTTEYGRAPVLWNLDQNASRRELEVVPAGEATGFAFSPDSVWLVSSHSNGSLALWNLGAITSDSSPRIRPTHRYWGGMGTTSLAFSGKDSIVTTDRFGTVRRWPISAGDFPDTWKGLESWIRPVVGRNLSRQEWRDYFEESGAELEYRRTFDDLPEVPAAHPAPHLAKQTDDENLQALSVLRELEKKVQTVNDDPPDQILEDIDRRLAEVSNLGFPKIAEEAKRDIRAIYGETLIAKAREALQAGDLEDSIQGFNVARTLVSPDRDWRRERALLRDAAKESVVQGRTEWSVELMQLEAQLGPAAPGQPKEPSPTFRPEDAKRLVGEEKWSKAQLLAAEGDFQEAEGLVAEAQQLGIALPGKASVVVRQFFCYRKLQEARQSLQSAINEEDPDFKRVPELVRQAKEVQAAVPAESADELVAQMVTAWRVRQLRRYLDPVPRTVEQLEPTFDKSKVPSLDWFRCVRLAGEVKAAANRGDMDTALANYAEIEKAGLTMLVLSNELNQLVWMGALAGRATEVLSAAELLLKMEPDNPGRRDSIGLVRALNGKIAESISDFEYYVICTSNSEHRERRAKWLESLRSGKPVSEVFSEAMMRELKEE